MSRRHQYAVWIGLLLAAGLWPILSLAQNQNVVFKGGKDFQLPSYYPATNGPLKKRTLLRGASYQFLSNNLVLLENPTIQSFREDGTTLDWTASARECVVNPLTKEVRGATNISFQTADERFFASGVGFFWHPSNSIIVISNQTRTWIEQGALTTTNRPSK